MSSTPMNRREALKLAGAASAGALSGALITRAAPPAASSPAKASTRPSAGIFTPHQRRTLDVLVDDILPRDERSGSATDAKVPEFMEAILLDKEVTPPLTPPQMRGGLAWLDAVCRHRFGRGYADCAAVERYNVLDDIAWPTKAQPKMRYGAEFFSKLRAFTASGFFSSTLGHEDLRYQGGVFTPTWTGCSEPALQRLGVSYADWDRIYGHSRTQLPTNDEHAQGQE